MISVVIQTANDDDLLMRTLAAIVDAAIEGVVSEVIIAESGSSDRIAAIADEAGCRTVRTGEIGDAIKMAKKDWLLFLEPGSYPVGDWLGPVMDHVGRTQTAARFSPAPGSRQRFLQRLMLKPSALCHGLLMTKRQSSVLARSHKTAEQLAQGVSARRLTAHIMPAGQ